MDTKTSFPSSPLHWHGRRMSKMCWKNTGGDNQTLELASISLSVCALWLMFNQKLDCMSHRSSGCAGFDHRATGIRSPARTQTITAHPVLRDWRVLVVLSGLSHSASATKAPLLEMSGDFWGISIPDSTLPLLCGKCWYSVTFTGRPSARSPAVITSISAPFLRRLQPTKWREAFVTQNVWFWNVIRL